MAHLKKSLNPIHTERKATPQKSKTQGAGDLYKAFSGIEEEILTLQACIERNKLKEFPDFYRVKASKGIMHPIASLLAVSPGETASSLQQTRNSVLVEPMYHLLSNSLGPQCSSLHQDTALRLLTLKSKFQETLLKKAAECLLLVYYRMGKQPIGSELLPNLIGLVESVERNQIEDSKANEQLLQRIKEMEEMLKKKEEVVKSHEAVMHTLEEQILHLKKDSEEIIKKMKTEAEETKQKENERVKTLEKKFKEAKDQLQAAEVVKHSQQEIEQLQQLTAQTQKLNQGLETRVKSLQQELLTQQSAHQKELQELTQAHSTALESADSTISVLKTECESLKQHKEGMSAASLTEISAMQSQISALSAEKVSLQSSLSSVSHDLSQQTAETEKLREFLDTSNSKLQKALEQLSKSTSADALLKKQEEIYSAEISALRSTVLSLEEKALEKVTEAQSIAHSLKSSESEIKYLTEMNERLQDQLAKLSEDYDEDTFENVMRYELAMMRQAYENKIKLLKTEHEQARRKLLNETKELKSKIAYAEHARDMAELRLKSLKP